MNTARINNFRMAAYAAFAVGLINLRYQTGSTDNLSKSAILFIPGAALLLLTLTTFGKKLLLTTAATAIVSIGGVALLAYSFLV
jgi:hypothetical protein